MKAFVLLAVAVAVASPAPGSAQTAPAPQTAGPQAGTSQAAAPQEAPAQAGDTRAPATQNRRAASYTYNSQGRRDPFLSLIGTGGDPTPPPRRMADGLAGMRVEDLSVRGVMQTRNQLVAMVQGTDNRTYVLHEGDKVADGVVKAVVPEGLIMLQEVSDPREKERTREVRKLLRGYEDGQR